MNTKTNGLRSFAAEVGQMNEGTWSDLLPQFEDANIYQTHAYGSVRWGARNLSHFVLRRDDRLIAMAQCRIVRSPCLPGGMAYLRWCPLCQPKHSLFNDGILSQVASGLVDEYIRKRGLWLRVLSHVPESDSMAQSWARAFESVGLRRSLKQPSYRTFLLDLRPPLEALRRGLDQKWRNQLNQAGRSNLTLIEGTSDTLFDKFISIYDEMFQRKQFETTVDVREFREIQAHLREGLKMRVMLCEHEGKPVSGVVASGIGDTGIYLLGATNTEGMKLKGSYLLQWQTIRWLKEQGCTRYDLGGINPASNPGVYHFKRGLSGVDSSHLGQFDGCRHPLSAVVVRLADWIRSRR